ncbi:MAG: hypothetical protein JOZ89_06745, partial [Gammaproteobacteria bacterium]|nr:hypothetical protein [Gammaproteobacteria bacterium]
MRRALRITAWTVGTVVMLTALLAAALLIAGNTRTGRAWLARTTATLTGGHVRLSGWSGSFPAAIDLEELQLSDVNGPWLTAQHLSLRWSPLALLARHVLIEELRIARLDIERRPVSQAKQRSSGSSSLPRTDLQRLAIGTLELGPQLAGSRATLAVEGAAHLISLQDAAARITLRRTDGAGGDYALDVRFDSAQLEGSLRLEEPAGGALENLLEYPGLGAVAVVAKLHGPRSGARLQLDARAGELRADAEGTVDLVHEAADLTYRVRSPAMTPRPGLSWQRLALAGEWHGPLNAPRAAARLALADLQFPGGALATLDATLGADGGMLAVHAGLGGLVLPGPQPRLLADSPLRVAATVRLNDAKRPLQLSADHRLFALQLHAVTAGTPRADFDLRVADLRPLAALAGQDLGGRTELKGMLEQRSATTRLDLEARTEMLPAGATVVAALLGGASQLHLTAALTDREATLERLSWNGRALSISVTGSAERGDPGAKSAVRSVHVRYELGISNLTPLSESLAGNLKATGRLDGPLDSLAAQAQLISSLAIRGSPAQTLEASLKARGLPSRPSATLVAQGGLAGAPLQLDASLERPSGRTFHVAVHRAQWQSARLEGDLTTG